MAPRCTPYANYAQRQKKKFDSNELSTIEAIRKRTARINRAANETSAAKNKAAKTEIARQAAIDKWIDNTGDVIRIFPEQRGRLQDFLVTMFGQKARALGLDPQRNYSLAGEVRFNLETFQQVAEGMVNLAGRIQSTERIKQFNEVLSEVTDGKNINSEDVARLSIDAREIGRIPRTMSNEVDYKMNVLGNTTSPMMRILKRRYDKFIDGANKLGLDNAEIDKLVDSATELTTVFDEVRAIATGVGVHIPNLENLGYFARIITDDFRLRMRDIDIPELFEQIRVGTVDLSTIFSRSRKTVHYIPEDAIAASQILGVSPQVLDVMLENPTEFRAYLHENLTTDQLDTLVTAGLFEKLPMSSTEVYDYFVKQYELPYSSITQMFEIDPSTAIQKYTNSLQQATGNSALIRGILDGRSFAAGWTVPKSIVNSDIDLYSNFIPLGDYLDRWASNAGVTPGQALIRLGIAGDELQGVSILNTLKDAYAHPIVAAQWGALMDISMSPALMGQFSNIVTKLNQFSNKTIIASAAPVYTLNNLLGSVTMTTAAGGNIGRYIPNLYDVVRALRGGLETFDNTRPYIMDNGKQLTRRQMVEKFLIHRGQQFAPGTVKMPYTFKSGNFNDFVKGVLDTPAAFFQALGDIHSYTVAKGNAVNRQKIPIWERPGRLSKATIQKMMSGLTSVFGATVYFSNLLEITGKLTALDTIMKKVNPFDEGKSIGAQAFTTAQFTRFDNLEEAFRHLDEYFVNGYSTGTVTAKLSGFVRPFATWAIANPPMQIRHMLRHPQLYMSYAKLNALNQKDMSQDERAIEAAIEPWILDSYPWYIGKNEKNQPMVMIPTSFDPIADAYVFFREGGQAIERMVGLRSGTAAEQRKSARNETTSDFINSQISTLFPLTRSLYEFAAGVDTFTGKKIDDNPAEGYPDFLGINLPPRLVLVAQRIPILGKLDAANPGGVFGKAPEIDNLTGEVVVPGVPSVFGGQRLRSDTRTQTYENAPLWVQTLMLAGLNIRTIDYDKNLQNTFGDIQTTTEYLEKSINENRVAIEIGVEKGTINKAEYYRRANVIRNQTTIWGQTTIDALRLQSYMKRTGVTPKQVLRELDKLKIQVRNLPLPGDEQLRPLAEKILIINQELNELESKVK